MSSRICVTVEPVTAALSTAASDCELRPSRRASSWSIRDAHLAGGLVPVEVDAPRVRAGRHDLGEPRSAIVPHLVHVRAADAILHRPADRRPELERGDPADHAREVLGQQLLELGLQPLARVHVLGDDHDLGEEVVRAAGRRAAGRSGSRRGRRRCSSARRPRPRRAPRRAARPPARWRRSRRCAAASGRPPARAGPRPGRTAPARSGGQAARAANRPMRDRDRQPARAHRADQEAPVEPHAPARAPARA